MSKAIGQSRSDDGSDAIGAVPRGHAQRLLGAAVPLGGDDGEEREAAGLEEAEEEARGEQGREVVAGGEGGGRDAPSQNERGHEEAVRHAHDEDAREGLPGQLRDGRDRAEQRVLVPREPRRLDQPERRRVAQHRLVQDLQEVHPHQHREDHFVRLSPDSLVLLEGARAKKCVVSGVSLCVCVFVCVAFGQMRQRQRQR